MLRHLFLFSLACTAISACSQAPTTPSVVGQQAIELVDPFIGTDGKGKTYPGATVPYGMVQLSPDNGRTGWDWISGYFYPDTQLAGFSHTHLSGTGAGDLYDISFFPVTQMPNGAELNSITTPFSHENEQASPGYYQVFLPELNVNVELTAGLRTGVQKYHYQDSSARTGVKLDLGYARNWDKTLASTIQVIDDYSIAGVRKSTGWAKDQRVYFHTQFSHKISQIQLFKGDQPIAGNHIDGVDTKAVIFFDVTAPAAVEIKTAISSVSMENAKQNLIADGIEQNFADYLSQAQQKWKSLLGRFDIDASHKNKVQFYTALYHSYLAPRVFSDSNGQYKGPDGDIHQANGFQRYSFFSLWDTFRALHPWKTITDVEHSKDMMQSLLAHYREYGLLPVWNFQGNETNMMMGYHAVPVLADAWFKGIIDTDPKVLLQAMKDSAMQADFGLKSYQKYGFVPFDERKWNVSLTLEYAFDDWSISQFAEKTGAEDDALYFAQRAQNYRHHFDANSGFMRAMGPKSTFRPDFDPLSYHPEDYCEANAWQYSFYVPHDIPGLITLHGGKAQLADKLDQMFTTEQASDQLPEWISGYIGQYVHGNEPAHHVPYLYQFVDQGHKTQQRVREIMDQLYTTAPDGLCGNEDAGQMSAWYMFSALGFYPVNPASGEYVLGSPEVNRATIQLENGRTFTVIAHNQSQQNVYVKEVRFNNQPLSGYILSHEQIMSGGVLEFDMSSTPL